MPQLNVGFPSIQSVPLGNTQPAGTAADLGFPLLASRLLRILGTPGTTSLATRLADEAAALFGDVRVALGACRDGARCHLLALSGQQQLDATSDYRQALDAVLHEATQGEELRTWTLGERLETTNKSLARLATLHNLPSIAAVRLGPGGGPAAGAMIVLGQVATIADPAFAPRIKGVAMLLAGLIPLVDRADERGVSRYLTEKLHRFTARKAWYLTAIGLLLAGLTLAPLPAWISCECLLEPHTRRFIAAPFAAKLEKTLVQPGELVNENQVLAVLDEQPVKIELAMRQAEFDEAIKKRDAALATRKASDAQVGELESAQIKSKMRDLEHRLSQLTVRSPMAGVVVRGDLKRSEGMPLEQGQSLFEIAPLEPMIAEVSIPEDEFRLVQVGQTARVRLDAFPGRRWTGSIARVHPRAEMRDEQSVFIAEIAIPNESGELRPGMRGSVRIDHDWQPLAWTWFRRPVTRFVRWLGW